MSITRSPTGLKLSVTTMYSHHGNPGILCLVVLGMKIVSKNWLSSLTMVIFFCFFSCFLLLSHSLLIQQRMQYTIAISQPNRPAKLQSTGPSTPETVNSPPIYWLCSSRTSAGIAVPIEQIYFGGVCKAVLQAKVWFVHKGSTSWWRRDWNT